MAQWTTEDGPVLEAAWRRLAKGNHVNASEVLSELGRGADNLPAVMRSMKLLIDSGYLDGSPLSGDATLLDVTVTGSPRRVFSA